MTNGNAIGFEPVVQNFVITPAPLAVNQSEPSSILDQVWMLVLTGVGTTTDFTDDQDVQGIRGNNPDDWRRLTFTFSPDINAPLLSAIESYSIPAPIDVPYFLVLSVDYWAPFVSISSAFHKNTDDAGFAVDAWRAAPFTQGFEDVNGNSLPNLFAGIEVDVAVRNDQAYIYRISYQITLVGKMGFLPG